ncbi:hypothetical protein M2372_002320 [Chryseobacterium sp. BIGb0232]|nr:hypothetical protein [Chryseobacterium sp. BIGb0232]ROS17528.1 hypothetical protein EDF65_1900 [Chryseobacterium nakagawai]
MANAVSIEYKPLEIIFGGFFISLAKANGILIKKNGLKPVPIEFIIKILRILR